MPSKLPTAKAFSKSSGHFCRCVVIFMVDLDMSIIKKEKISQRPVRSLEVPGDKPFFSESMKYCEWYSHTQ